MLFGWGSGRLTQTWTLAFSSNWNLLQILVLRILVINSQALAIWKILILIRYILHHFRVKKLDFIFCIVCVIKRFSNLYQTNRCSFQPVVKKNFSSTCLWTIQIKWNTNFFSEKQIRKKNHSSLIIREINSLFLSKQDASKSSWVYEQLIFGERTWFFWVLLHAIRRAQKFNRKNSKRWRPQKSANLI